ncbi:sigma 54-interacting transcriptional regulator [Planktothrix sp. FACHB-1355]|uniref:Sigma 54-interacting transcriptional regulator n=1 Tax=Aerosakkonema funiforme FACHB-1375 TaxID=2949571 RepID=A0A926VA54_9CYAN|nr:MULTISPECIES: cyclic nucleotide-binding domain-containing protein [Oscillatoriales]MBD2180011.1 sigma 54-interacting transcriptional regulator [Aerosakkonema funiforme FACHB-1375]MBD3559134.1 sigma 54-interacting transcriptional regulator [Planktothrix sp. FACHB-1355]
MNSATTSTDIFPSRSILPFPDRPLPLPFVSDRTIPSDERVIAEYQDWLGTQRIWGSLPESAKEAIARSFHSFPVEAGTHIYLEGQTPIGLYLLKLGKVEIFRDSPIGKLSIRYRHPGDLFGYTLVASSDEGTYHSSAIALTASEILFLPQSQFLELVTDYPAIQQALHTLLMQELDDFASRIAWEEERIRGLQPYIQHIPIGETILGNSKATQKLAQQIEKAASNLQPVVFQALPGTGKTFLAGLIHLRSQLADQPFAELDCAELPRTTDGRLNTDVLFGRINKQPGILELLERGTLLLDNVHVLSEGDRTRLIHYLKTGFILPNHGISDNQQLSEEPPQPVQSSVRLIFASPSKLIFSDLETISLKLFSLSQRKADIPAFANYFLNRCCREQNRLTLLLDRADLRRLIGYEYPGNLAELAEILHRAVMMTPSGQSVIPEQALWSVQSTKNAFRIDLLTHVPWLRQLFLSRWYPEAIWIVMMAIFVPITILGFIGSQSRDSSITLNLFWAWWWPGYLFLFAFVGRLWCAICPFMIAGEWMRRLSLWLFPRQQLTWNTQWLNRWGAWVVFAGFLIIYLWEKLWDLPHHAYLSAWLLVAITAGAVIFSLIYERRLWCRYLCPIGGMNGMFAKLSMTELRSTQQVCGSQCSTFGCYKGSAETPLNFADALPNEGQATEGCPLYSHPAQLQDNRDCMLCMTCLKTCPNRSAQLNLRFPASDLLDNHQGFWAEAALLLLLFGGVFMHHSHTILSWLGFEDVPVDADRLLTSLPIALGLLSIPAILTYATHTIARFCDRSQPDYLTIIYAYLPFALAANLAYYVPAAITEAGQILPVFARSFGYSGAGLPTLTWSLDVAQFLQGVTLLSAMVFSPYPLLRITKRGDGVPIMRSLLSNLPHLLLMAGLTIFLFQLII